MTDPITDMLNRIRNAEAVFHQTAVIPFSNLKYEVAKILEKEGFLDKAEKKGKGNQKIIEISLKYQKSVPAGEGSQKMNPAISGIKRISKPGQRLYVDFKKIKSVRDGYGISIISTSKGLMTNKDARRQKIGGEIICEVW